MNYNWEDIKWIFERDGTLRDIYVNDITVNDWAVLFNYLNKHFTLKAGSAGSDKIDTDKAFAYLKDETEDFYTISIFIDSIMINCHLFSDTEIEFDIDSIDIKSAMELDKVLHFMALISLELNKPIILTGENQIDFPLITIEGNTIKEYLSKEDAMKRWR